MAVRRLPTTAVTPHRGLRQRIRPSSALSWGANLAAVRRKGGSFYEPTDDLGVSSPDPSFDPVAAVDQATMDATAGLAVPLVDWSPSYGAEYEATYGSGRGRSVAKRFSDKTAARRFDPAGKTPVDITDEMDLFEARLRDLRSDPNITLDYDRALEDLDNEGRWAAEEYDLAIGDLERQRQEIRDKYGIDSPYIDQLIVQEQDRYRLQLKAINLEIDKLTKDVAKAKELVEDVDANAAAIQEVYDKYQQTLAPYLEEAIAVARQFFPQASEGAAAIAAQEKAGLVAAEEAATAALLEDVPGLEGAALAEATGIATDRLDLHAERAQHTADSEQAVLEALGEFSVKSAEATKAIFGSNLDRRRMETAAKFAMMGDQADEALRAVEYQEAMARWSKEAAEFEHGVNVTDLDYRKKLLDHALSTDLADLDYEEQRMALGYRHLVEQIAIEKERSGMDRQTALDSALDEVLGMDALELGISVGERWLNDRLEGTDPARLGWLEETFGTLILSGHTDPSQVQTIAEEQRWGLSAEEIYALETAISAYRQATEQWKTQSSTQDVHKWKGTAPNGRISRSALTPIGGGIYMAPVAAPHWQEMVAAAKRDGVSITIGECYRDYSTQVRLAREKGLYKDGGWAAVPGTSNHGWGLAVDIRRTNASVAWLRANAHRYGFHTISREPWHWEFRGFSG